MGVDDIVAILAGVGAIVWFVRTISGGHEERHAEDDARAYFDRHGRWPDEDPTP